MRFGRGHRIACVVAIAGALTAIGAANGAERFVSRVSINKQPGGTSQYTFGRVRSPKAPCERRRRVQVQQDAEGPPIEWQGFGEAVRTKRDGTWRSPGKGLYVNGRYRAVALKKAVRGGVCKRAISEPVFFD